MARRASSRVYTSSDGIIARAGRAGEDPAEMTVSATQVRMATFVAEVLKKNPDLTPLQAARAAHLLMKAEMHRLARKSAEARKQLPA